jgi:hypothetical protein
MSADNPQLIQLSPNSNCSAAGSGDVNNSTLVQFMTPPNQLVCWSIMVSMSAKTMELNSDNCCRSDYVNCDGALVTFKKGLTVTYQPSSGDVYYVLLSGNIVDSGKTYSFNNLVIYASGEPETD